MAKRKPTPAPEPKPLPSEQAPVDRRLAWLDRMRPFRERRERDVSVGSALRALEHELRSQHDAVGDVIDVWNAIAPANVRGLASIAGVAQGTLTLAVETSGASYELSRALRDGLEQSLLKRLPARVRRIRVKVAADTQK